MFLLNPNLRVDQQLGPDLRAVRIEYLRDDLVVNIAEYTGTVRGAKVTRNEGDSHRRGRDHGADRKIELARDHQQTDGKRDDANFRSHVQEAGKSRGPEECGAAQHREEHIDNDHPNEGSRLRPAGQSTERCA